MQKKCVHERIQEVLTCSFWTQYYSKSRFFFIQLLFYIICYSATYSLLLVYFFIFLLPIFLNYFFGYSLRWTVSSRDLFVLLFIILKIVFVALWKLHWVYDATSSIGKATTIAFSIAGAWVNFWVLLRIGIGYRKFI